MGFSLSITGDASRVEKRIRAAVAGGLGRQMGAGLNRAAKPFRPAIQAEAGKTMPSGYAPVLAPSIRVKTQLRTSAATAEALLRVSAMGRGQLRHLPALDAGRLRHPLYGNRIHWFNQRVRPGVVRRPAVKLRPAALRELSDVVRDVARQMGG